MEVNEMLKSQFINVSTQIFSGIMLLNVIIILAVSIK